VLSRNAVDNSVRPSAFSVRAIHDPVLRTQVSLATSSLRPATLTQQTTLELLKETIKRVMSPTC
jgi:LysR family nitrogen assimilation transcriptional regulator